MARCYQCGVQTNLYCNGSPVCNACNSKLSHGSQNPTMAELNARVKETRSAYTRALIAQRAVFDFKRSLDPNNPDGSLAIHKANQEVERASMELHKALRDFITAIEPGLGDGMVRSSGRRKQSLRIVKSERRHDYNSEGKDSER